MPDTPGAFHANTGRMSGNKQHKKDGTRKEKATSRRRRVVEQPIAGSVTRERGQATSNFTDGEIAGADHKHDAEGRLKRRPSVSEPRRRR
jgi:hypothetical protein